jgi:hypothetical protein
MDRWYRPTMLGLTVLISAVAAGLLVARYRAFDSLGLVGVDLRLFSELGQRWLETGSIYADFQLAGPYRYDQAAGSNDVERMPALYPPWSGPAFVVVRFMPWPLWWLIPLGTLAWLVWRWRPAPWTWPLMALALVHLNTSGMLVAGNSTMWIAMFAGLGLRYGWPACLVALKPTLLPFALVAWRDRGMWTGLAVFAMLAVGWYPESARALLALRNVEGGSLLYSLGDLPFMLVPLIGYAGRSLRDGSAQRPVERVVLDRDQMRDGRAAVGGDRHVGGANGDAVEDQRAAFRRELDEPLGDVDLRRTLEDWVAALVQDRRLR